MPTKWEVGAAQGERREYVPMIDDDLVQEVSLPVLPFDSKGVMFLLYSVQAKRYVLLEQAEDGSL